MRKQPRNDRSQCNVIQSASRPRSEKQERVVSGALSRLIFFFLLMPYVCVFFLFVCLFYSVRRNRQINSVNK